LQRTADRLQLILLMLGMSFFLLSSCPPVAAQTSAPKAPRNIVFILIDDLRYDTFGFMGHPFIETPHIDSLARDGVHFQNAFVTTSLCSPARASFLTGQYMHHHGVIDNGNLMKPSTITFPKLLQKSGYETAFIGKWHMGGSTDQPRPGFNHWVSFRGQGTYFPKKQTINVNGKRVPRTKYMTDELTDYSVDFLKRQSAKKPFLLYLSHKGVHGLYDPADRHRDVYKNVKYDLPKSMADTAENYRDKPMWLKNQRNSWHGVDFPYHGRSGQTVSEMYRHYCEMILSIDDSVGTVLETLKENNLADNTLVVFTSDGGHFWGEHGLIDKRCAYEESMRIPLLAYCPKLLPQKKVSALVANVDLGPTFLEMANIDIPKTMDGKSLLPFLVSNKRPADWRDDLFYEYYWEFNFPQTPTTLALRTDRYKLIQYHGIWDIDELYDIKKDPQEMKNLIFDPVYRQTVSSMRNTLYQRLKESDGVSIPFGLKRSLGSNLRNATGSQPAKFSRRFIQAPQESSK